MLNYSCRTDFIICNHFFLCHKKSFLQKEIRKKLSDYNITEKIKTDNTFSFAQQLCVCKLDKMKKYQNR